MQTPQNLRKPVPANTRGGVRPSAGRGASRPGAQCGAGSEREKELGGTHRSAPCCWRAGVCCSGWTQPGFRVSGWPGRSPQRSTGLSGQVRGRRAPGKQGSGLDQRGWGGPRWAESAAPGDRAAHHLRLALLLKRPVSLSRVWMKPGWMKHKLGSRLLGEISVTSDMQMTPPYGRK